MATTFTDTIQIESPFNRDDDDDFKYVDLVVTFTHIPGCKATHYDPPEGPENEIIKIEMFSEEDSKNPILYPEALYDFLAEKCQGKIDQLGERFYQYDGY